MLGTKTELYSNLEQPYLSLSKFKDDFLPKDILVIINRPNEEKNRKKRKREIVFHQTKILAGETDNLITRPTALLHRDIPCEALGRLQI